MNVQMGLDGVAPHRAIVPSLVSSYPGQKLGPYFDILRASRDDWPVIIEPFAGSGYTSLNLCAQQTFLGETQDFYWLWKTWASDWSAVESEIRVWQGRFLPLVQAFQREGLTPRQKSEIVRDSEVWQSLRAAYLPHRDGSRGVPSVAAAWVLRRVGWMSIGRTSRDGSWNVPADTEKLAKFSQRPLPRFPTPRGSWSIGNGWEECLDLYEAHGDKSLEAVALVDPPYFFPADQMPSGNRQTSVYPGHDPHDWKWAEVFDDCLGRLASMPSVTRIVAWNYRSEATDGSARGAAIAHNREMTTLDLGTLRQMSLRRSSGPPSPAREGGWILGPMGGGKHGF